MFKNKKSLIVLIVLGAGSFVASFFLSSMMGTSKRAATKDEATKNASIGASETALASLSLSAPKSFTPSQEQFQELVKQLQSEKQEYRLRNRRLDEREKRLVIAREMLAKQAKQLEDLRSELVAPLMRLKEMQSTLDASRVLIRREEQANLKKTASIYEKMDASAASRIFESMCSNSQGEDVVRLLYYMSERSAAEILASIKDERVAAELSERLKRVREVGS